MVSPILPFAVGALMSRNEIVDRQDELTGQIVDTVSENYFAKSGEEKIRLKNYKPLGEEMDLDKTWADTFGDKSDELPGVRGIGVKTLIIEFPLLVEDRVFNTKDLLDMANSRNTRISKMIQDSELIIKRNYLLMQLGDPNIKNQTKLKIGDSVREMVPKLVKYQLQTLFVKDKLWGQIPNFDNWLTEFNILDHYWKNKK